jgi:hypothetical protein
VGIYSREGKVNKCVVSTSREGGGRRGGTGTEMRHNLVDCSLVSNPPGSLSALRAAFQPSGLPSHSLVSILPSGSLPTFRALSHTPGSLPILLATSRPQRTSHSTEPDPLVINGAGNRGLTGGQRGGVASWHPLVTSPR